MQIEKAKESLQAAELCFANKLYNSTANRAYYAMFQAAVVALEVGGAKAVGARWSHKRVQSTFSSELIKKRKVYPRSLAQMLPKGLDIRNEGDYETSEISKRQANQMLRWARNFVERVEKVVT